MSSSRTRTMLSVNLDAALANDPLRELFEACKTGDIIKVKKLITPQTVNARDTAGRKSTPLHFAAGKHSFITSTTNFFLNDLINYTINQVFTYNLNNCNS